MRNLTRPIADIVADVQSGKLTAVELVQESLDAIAADSHHTVLEANPQALDQARALDAEIAAGRTDGALLGVPYIAKDNFLTVGTHTTAASNILKPFAAPFESTATQKLKGAGAILVAKANLDAFGHGASTENSDFGPTKNPIDPERVAGGSSGGSAAAVRLGLASFAIGTDTGGSIRQPSSFCGVVGLKPTYGRVSRFGVVAMASSTDCIGPIARTVPDAALVLDVLAGKDRMDGTTIERAETYAVDAGQTPKRVGIIKEFLDGLEPAIRARVDAAAEALRAAGSKVVEVSLPSIGMALPCYYILVPAEISSNLSRYDGVRYGHRSAEADTLSDLYLRSRDEGFGAEAKRRILIGTYVLSSGYYDAYYKRAQKVRSLLMNDFQNVFDDVDALLGPITPSVAFRFGENSNDPVKMYLEDVMTVGPSLVGVPSISVPAGTVDGLPVGVQIMAAQGDEATVLAAAAAVEGGVQ